VVVNAENAERQWRQGILERYDHSPRKVVNAENAERQWRPSSVILLCLFFVSVVNAENAERQWRHFDTDFNPDLDLDRGERGERRKAMETQSDEPAGP